jgi:hypothetical protein
MRERYGKMTESEIGKRTITNHWESFACKRQELRKPYHHHLRKSGSAQSTYLF